MFRWPWPFLDVRGIAVHFGGTVVQRAVQIWARRSMLSLGEISFSCQGGNWSLVFKQWSERRISCAETSDQESSSKVSPVSILLFASQLQLRFAHGHHHWRLLSKAYSSRIWFTYLWNLLAQISSLKAVQRLIASATKLQRDISVVMNTCVVHVHVLLISSATEIAMRLKCSLGEESKTPFSPSVAH